MAIVKQKEGSGFNRLGYLFHPCVCIRFGARYDEPNPLDRNRFFCSELITIMIQEQSKTLLNGINPRDTSPKMLYDYLVKSGECEVVCTNPLLL